MGCSSPALSYVRKKGRQQLFPMCTHSQCSHWPTTLARLTPASSSTHGATICLLLLVSPGENDKKNFLEALLGFFAANYAPPDWYCTWPVSFDGGRVSVSPKEKNNYGDATLLHYAPKGENFKKKVNLLKLPRSSLRMWIHFSALDLRELKTHVCWHCWFGPCHLSCPAVLPASLRLAADAVEFLWLCSKEPLALFQELSWLLSGIYFLFLLYPSSPPPPQASSSDMPPLPLQPSHQTQHTQKLCLTLHALKTIADSPEDLLRLLSFKEFTEEVILRGQVHFLAL